MGNDGGSIPKRREVVREKHREERKENYEIAKAKARLPQNPKTPHSCKKGQIILLITFQY